MSRHNAPVIVIGAGLAGLSSALALARAGREVIVLEAAEQPGGCCSTAQVDGYTFNNGAVYVAVPSLLRRTFEQLGLDLDAEASLVPVDHPHETHLDDGTTVHLDTADTARVEGAQAASRTALLRDGLRQLQKDWQPLYRRLLDGVLPFEPSLPRSLAQLWRYLPKLAGQADHLIARYFPDPSLQAAVASILLYTGTAPERLPASQLIGLLALLEEGFHLPRAGMGALTAAPLRALRILGVPVRCGCKVERIEAGRRGVTGVVLAGGERLPATDVIATCSGFSVVNDLLPAEGVPRALQRTARKAPLSHRAVAIQLGGRFDELSESFIVNHVPAMNRQGEMHRAGEDTPHWLSWTSPSRVLSSVAPTGKAVIELYAPVSGIDTAEQWTASMTERAVEGHLDALRRHLPSMQIETMRTMDPPAFVHERHLYEGALYGIAPGAQPNAYFPHRTALPGLHLAGQTTFPGFGVPTAMLSGIQAATGLLAASH